MLPIMDKSTAKKIYYTSRFLVITNRKVALRSCHCRSVGTNRSSSLSYLKKAKKYILD